MSNYLRKILITGGNGQLAHAIRNAASAKDYQLAFCSHTEMDIADAAACRKMIDAFTPDIIVNTAAYTAVDKAEQEIDLALRANHIGAQNLAVICRKSQIPFIHISTDYVFDGTSGKPYHELDAANPVNMYGKSKWLGEEAVREQCEQAIILRVSGVFSEYGNNFLRTMLRLAQEKKELRIVADQITCPTYAGDIAQAIFSLAKSLSHWGTYHFCNSNPVSWHQFALAIINEARQHKNLSVEEVKAITTAEYPTAAKRPAYSVLDCSKISRDYGIVPPIWDVAVKQIVSTLLQVQ